MHFINNTVSICIPPATNANGPMVWHDSTHENGPSPVMKVDSSGHKEIKRDIIYIQI